MVCRVAAVSGAAVTLNRPLPMAVRTAWGAALEAFHPMLVGAAPPRLPCFCLCVRVVRW